MLSVEQCIGFIIFCIRNDDIAGARVWMKKLEEYRVRTGIMTQLALF